MVGQALSAPVRQAVRRRLVVVGAGVTGLITAVRCVLAGHDVTVVDRGPIPHPGSSSFDQHRALRALQPADVAATRRGAVAHHRWLELQAMLCGAPDDAFYRQAGVVTTWPRADVAAVTAVAAQAGLPVRPVESDEFPHLRFPAGTRGVLELDAGVLLAERVLRAAARWLAAHPAARLRPWCAASSVDADTGRAVLADGTVERGDVVLVAGGPWSGDLVGRRTLIHRQTMVYLQPPAELARYWERSPSAGGIGADGRGWLLPSGDGTLLKISTDAACREVPGVDAEDDDELAWSERVLAAGLLTDLHRYTVAAVKRCHYAVDVGTRAGRLVRVGPTVWARAASGADGFRTAPLVADHIVGLLQPPDRSHASSTGRNTL